MIHSAHHQVLLILSMIFGFEEIVNFIKILPLNFTWWSKSSECLFFLSFLMIRSAHHQVLLILTMIFDFERIVNFIKILLRFFFYFYVMV